ncbi:interferon-inducible GTPase 5-like [Carassius gibelio]|uniref:interferon-inducible GTPase 5-like n=1 Tax=Carassius gibelio TaxID=101364 RepID=UPI002277922D|nr:interferon-inducible GTPase 5-like [Carassius gibelio]
MEIQKQELLSGAVCPDAKESQDDTDNVFLCKAKENIHLKSESTENRESINTTPKKQEEEHIYEVPDVILTSSAEYIYETGSVKEPLKHLDNVTLHIAVTGSTGAGKSSFINAIRGLKPDDINAAPTGVTETTVTSTVYAHPTMPSVKFWDLPGTGSPKFKAKKYLKDVKLETFDFFIIISSERFKENDIMLAKAIKEKKKLFYFLRSKIDNDIRAESQRKDFDEQKVLSHIREDCHRNLNDVNNLKPEIFLISSFELHKYDFQTLIDTLEKQLPAHKRDALILSLPIYSSKILDEKIELFMKQTWSAAVASGSIAVAPVPGLSMACDAAILLAFFTKCYYAFGLDDESIDKLSVRVNNPSLKSVRKSPLVIAIGQKKLSSKELSALTNREAAVKFAWSMVPVVGSKKTAEMSYSATLNLLRAGVQDLAETAKEVLKVAGLTDVY